MTPDEILHQIFAPLETPEKEWPAELIHYTTADAVFHICKTKKIQFSASSATNDSAELYGALAVLFRHATSDVHKNWGIAMHAAWPEFLPAFVPYFNTLTDRFREQLYLSCWCEADAAHPEGKLSMWRAYGADGRGMALGISTKPFIAGREKGRVPIQLFKTRYEDDVALSATLQHGADVLLAHVGAAKAYAATEGIDAVCWFLAQYWIQVCATRKHPGFSEENEWRLLYYPAMDDDGVFSNALDVTVVRGQLRPRLLVEIRDYSDLDFPGTTFDELVQYAIIGPNTADRSSAWRAAYMLLRDAGCANAEQKVRACMTPYRSAV